MIVGGFRRYHHAWCYWHYLRCNSGDLASTSSHMCGSWNLPVFLLRDGSFTLIKIASLMFLAILLSSLPTILKLSRDTSWPVVFWWSMMGDGALICSLNLSPKSSARLSNVVTVCSLAQPITTCKSCKKYKICAAASSWKLGNMTL